MIFSSGTFDIVEPAATAGANTAAMAKVGAASFDPAAAGELPLRLVNRPDRARTLARLLLFVPGLCALLAPAALAVYLIGSPASAGGQEGASFAALVAIPLVWLALAVAAGLSIVPRIGRSRVVTINHDQISALECGLTGERSWQLPLSDYRGIAHHVRASAGVVSHEVILVHDDPARSVLLMTAPIVHQSSIDRLERTLRLPAIPSREVYRTRLSAMRWPLWARVDAADGDLALEARA